MADTAAPASRTAAAPDAARPLSRQRPLTSLEQKLQTARALVEKATGLDLSSPVTVGSVQNIAMREKRRLVRKRTQPVSHAWQSTHDASADSAGGDTAASRITNRLASMASARVAVQAQQQQPQQSLQQEQQQRRQDVKQASHSLRAHAWVEPAHQSSSSRQQQQEQSVQQPRAAEGTTQPAPDTANSANHLGIRPYHTTHRKLFNLSLLKSSTHSWEQDRTLYYSPIASSSSQAPQDWAHSLRKGTAGWGPLVCRPGTAPDLNSPKLDGPDSPVLPPDKCSTLRSRGGRSPCRPDSVASPKPRVNKWNYGLEPEVIQHLMSLPVDSPRGKTAQGRQGDAGADEQEQGQGERGTSTGRLAVRREGVRTEGGGGATRPGSSQEGAAEGTARVPDAGRGLQEQLGTSGRSIRLSRLQRDSSCESSPTASGAFAALLPQPSLGEQEQQHEEGEMQQEEQQQQQEQQHDGGDTLETISQAAGGAAGNDHSGVATGSVTDAAVGPVTQTAAVAARPMLSTVSIASSRSSLCRSPPIPARRPETAPVILQLPVTPQPKDSSPQPSPTARSPRRASPSRLAGLSTSSSLPPWRQQRSDAAGLRHDHRRDLVSPTTPGGRLSTRYLLLGDMWNPQVPGAVRPQTGLPHDYVVGVYNPHEAEDLVRIMAREEEDDRRRALAKRLDKLCVDLEDAQRKVKGPEGQPEVAVRRPQAHMAFSSAGGGAAQPPRRSPFAATASQAHSVPGSSQIKAESQSAVSRMLNQLHSLGSSGELLSEEASCSSASSNIAAHARATVKTAGRPVGSPKAPTVAHINTTNVPVLSFGGLESVGGADYQMQRRVQDTLDCGRQLQLCERVLYAPDR